MKSVNARVIVITAAMLVLAACVSTSSTPQNQVSMNQASQDNVALGVAYLQQGRRGPGHANCSLHCNRIPTMPMHIRRSACCIAASGISTRG